MSSRTAASVTPATPAVVPVQAVASNELAREEQAAGRRLDLQLLRRLFGLLRGQGRRLRLVLLAEVLLVGSVVLRPLLFQFAIDRGLPADGAGGLDFVPLWVLGMAGIVTLLWALRFGLMAWSNVLAGDLAIAVLGDLRRRLACHVATLDVAYFDRVRAGRIVACADRDADNLQPLLVDGPPVLLATSLRCLFAGVMLAWMAWPIFSWLLPLVPVLMLAMIGFRRLGIRLWGAAAEARAQVTSALVETVGGVRVIQQAVHEDANRARYHDLLRAMDRRTIRATAGFAWFQPLAFLLFSLGICIVLVRGGEAVVGGQMSLGQLTASVFYVFLFLGPLQELGDLFERAATASAAGARIFLLLDTPARIHDPIAPAALPPAQGAIRFEGVTFGYDPQRPVLAGFDLVIPPGQTLAIVGPTGHGKSTLVQLLVRFYEVQQGRVLVDGVDLRDWPQDRLRQRIGIVLQDNVLFAGSVLDNLRLARPEADDATLIAAARELGADRVLERLPQGWHSEVGPEGRALSAGQRQLVCLVRAALADPAVLVLDEATSAVDLATERRLQLALSRLVRGRTALVIAHRLATVRDADRVIVLQDGCIVEDGSPAALLAAGGLYARLHADSVRAEVPPLV